MGAKPRAYQLKRRRRHRAAGKGVLGEHLGEPLTLQGVADALFVSRTHLCTAFKQATGSSVGTYLHDIRMQRARELLRSTVLPVAEVSRAVGYARQSSFAEAFNEDAGITPTEWRRKVQQTVPLDELSAYVRV